jgi:hypothetical protein
MPCGHGAIVRDGRVVFDIGGSKYWRVARTNFERSGNRVGDSTSVRGANRICAMLCGANQISKLLTRRPASRAIIAAVARGFTRNPACALVTRMLPMHRR